MIANTVNTKNSYLIDAKFIYRLEKILTLSNYLIRASAEVI